MEPPAQFRHVYSVSDYSESTDQDLWLLALKGNEAAFSAVYDRYARRLFNYAYRHTASSSRAEDVVSLVMLESWRRRTAVRFLETGSMAPWLFATAHYVLANERRATRRHQDILQRVAHMADAAAPPTIDQRLIDGERLRLVLSRLARLPKRDREVLMLAGWSGLSEAEMAATLGIPTGTLKSRLSRARRKLADRTGSTVLKQTRIHDGPQTNEVIS